MSHLQKYVLSVSLDGVVVKESENFDDSSSKFAIVGQLLKSMMVKVIRETEMDMFDMLAIKCSLLNENTKREWEMTIDNPFAKIVNLCNTRNTYVVDPQITVVTCSQHGGFNTASYQEWELFLTRHGSLLGKIVCVEDQPEYILSTPKFKFVQEQDNRDLLTRGVLNEINTLIERANVGVML